MDSQETVDGSDEPRIVQWLIDTRPLWPVKKAKARDEVQQLKTVVSVLFRIRETLH